MKISPKPQKGLSREAKKLWNLLQSEYGIVDGAGLDLLNDYAQFYDRREQARVTIKADGATIKNRFGQTIAHPSTRLERDSSAAMLKCLRALNLDLEPLHNRPGRPGGR
jgi:phage terminase small subunit